MSETAEDWEENPRGMLTVYQRQPYKMGESIADLIDNSYDANAKKIDVKIDIDPETNELYIRILDDGDGIPDKSWKDIMTLGASKKRPESELGIYGVGMKLSSLSQADEVTIASVNNAKFGLRRISADYIKTTNKKKLLRTSTGSAAYQEGYEEMVSNGWSTMVLLEKIHSERQFRSLGTKRTVSLNKEIKRIRIHLGLIFERVMKSKLRGHVKIVFNEKELVPLDPFFEWDNDPRFGSILLPKIPINFEIKGDIVPVLIIPSIIPHRNRTKDLTRRKLVESGYNKANKMQGLYIYRNERLIQYGGWNGLFGDTDEEHNKLGKIAIHVPPGYEGDFGLSPTKNQLYLPTDFLNMVKKKMEEPRQWGQIKNSSKLSFSEAFKHRYNNEGKGAAKAKTKSKSSKTKQSSTKEEGLFDPSKRPRKKEMKPKRGVVRSIEKEGSNTIVSIDNSVKESEDLIRMIRRWQE